MSVLIKGLKMPTSCVNGGCPIDGRYCDLWWKGGGGSYGRHRDCPLIELPDHGDLIDRDALPKYTGYALSANDVANAVINANVIIPAERSEDGET